MKRWLISLPILGALLLVAAAPAFTPPGLSFAPGSARVELPVPDLTDDVIAGAESRLTWHSGEQRTEWAIVSLHGFSASRQETAPLAEKIAAALYANLYEVRLSGHGLRQNALHDVVAEDWLRDTEQAIAAGAALGNKVVLIGTSTGATLIASMIGSETMRYVDTLVMLSPNFGVRDASATWLTRPYGRLLAKAFAGDTRTWEPHNELQGRYWTTSYPTSALIEVMRLVDRANAGLPATIDQRLLVFYSRDDQVVLPPAIVAAYDLIASPQKALVEIRNPGDPSHHVLAGDILSPGSTDSITRSIVEFISRPAP